MLTAWGCRSRLIRLPSKHASDATTLTAATVAEVAAEGLVAVAGAVTRGVAVAMMATGGRWVAVTLGPAPLLAFVTRETAAPPEAA